jgi:hypothetical protein
MPGASPIGSASAASPNAVASPGGWHPTILYMVGLIIAEILVIGWMLRFVGSR